MYLNKLIKSVYQVLAFALIFGTTSEIYAGTCEGSARKSLSPLADPVVFNEDVSNTINYETKVQTESYSECYNYGLTFLERGWVRLQGYAGSYGQTAIPENISKIKMTYEDEKTVITTTIEKK